MKFPAPDGMYDENKGQCREMVMLCFLGPEPLIAEDTQDHLGAEGSPPNFVARQACVILPNMATNQLTTLRHVTIKRATINQMLETLQKFGSHGCEGLVLWLGLLEPNTGKAHVTHAFVPEQESISNEDGVGYFVNTETLFKFNRALSETGLRLIAQVHSHPREAYHSEADDRYAIITAEGGLSLVVPNFGHAPAHPTAWAVYRLHGREWRELSARDVGSIFEVIEDS